MRLHRGLAPAAAAWTHLEATTRHHPQQSLAWLAGWQDHVGEPRGLEAWVLQVDGPDGAPWLLWPLGRSRRAGLAELRGLGGSLSDYQGPLVSPACPEEVTGAGFPALWARALAALPRVDAVHLDRLPAQLGSRRHPALALDARRVPADAHSLALPGRWEDLLLARSSARSRATWRRKLRRMEDHGPVRLRVARTAAERLALLPEALALKSAGYRALGVPDLFADPGRRRFLEEQARRPDSPLHVSALQVGDRLWATHVGLLHQGRFQYLFPGYRRDAPHFLSPGDELCRRLLAWCCAAGVETFDFTLGDEPYKERWADRREPQYALTQACTRRGRVLARARELLRQGRTALKARPALHARAQDLRTALGRRWHTDPGEA